MAENRNKTLLQSISLLGLALCAGLACYGFSSGILTSPDALQKFIARFGAAGAVLFIAFEAVQEVIPILPGGLGCLGGVLLFGPWYGFLYNYIGICIGSLWAFGIAKNCGRPILKRLFSDKTIQKYDTWTETEGRFDKLFALAIFLPVAPDDFLCYLAGTTRLSWTRFTTIILLGKPAAIALYSLGLTAVFGQISAWLR